MRRPARTQQEIKRGIRAVLVYFVSGTVSPL